MICVAFSSSVSEASHARHDKLTALRGGPVTRGYVKQRVHVEQRGQRSEPAIRWLREISRTRFRIRHSPHSSKRNPRIHSTRTRHRTCRTVVCWVRTAC